MQQINSLYRGDNSDNLASIMGMQYAPQNQLNKFTGDMAMTGLQGIGATNRLSMQLASQQMMEQNRLREQARSTNLNYMLGDRNASVAEGRLGMEMAGQQFGQQRDVAQFGLDKTYKLGSLANQERANQIADYDSLTKRITANEPGFKRSADINASDKSAEAGWSVWDKTSGFVRSQLQKQYDDLDPTKIDDMKQRTEALNRRALIKQRLDNYDKHVGWARGEYSRLGSSFLTPFFASKFGTVDSLYDLAGLGLTQPEQPKENKPQRPLR